MDVWDKDSKRAWARSTGKSATQAKIQWQVTVKGFQARCLPKDDGCFVVQFKHDKGWEDTQYIDSNPLNMLTRTVARIVREAEKIPGFIKV